MTEKYLGVALVDAEPMNRADYNTYRGWELPADENGKDLGYLKGRGTDHEQWDPKEKFDKQNFLIVGENSTIAEEDVNNFIGSVVINTLKIGGESKSTLVTVVLKNGFVIHETSSCVDPNNYDEKVGADICMRKIQEKIWGYLGFLLQCGVSGFKAVK